MAYNDDIEPAKIYVEPPDSNILTDEDSGDEDDGAFADNLNRRQLTARAEIVLANDERIGDTENIIGATEDNILERDAELSRPRKEFIAWVNGDIIPNERSFPERDFSFYKNISFVEIFEKFINEELISFLVEESTNYALFLNEPDPKISADEMKCFIAILFLTGYCNLPGPDFYWDSQDDMNNHVVSNSMRRDRFRQILKYLHCADNKPDNSDKLWKLRPFMDKLRTNFMNNWVAENDESMIKYFGRHSCKQFIRGKPIRFGYKMWCLNDPTGYLVNFDLYQGKNPKGNVNREKQFGKCITQLLGMIDEFPETVKNFHSDSTLTT